MQSAVSSPQSASQTAPSSEGVMERGCEATHSFLPLPLGEVAEQREDGEGVSPRDSKAEAEKEKRGFDYPLSRLHRQLSQRESQVGGHERSPDFEGFLEHFGDVSPGDIPLSVWGEVKAGKDLVSAFALHEVKRLRAEIERLESEAKARSSALPGVSSVGGRAKSDPFIEGFREG